MSFFKRLKEKLSGKSEEKLQQDTVEETAEQSEDVQNEADDVEETSKEVIEEKNETIETEETFSDDSEKAEETLGDDVETVQQEDEKEEEKKPSAWSITQKFKIGLAKTRDTFTSKVNDLIARYRKVDEEFFEELEEILLQADVGFETVMELMDELRFEVQRKNIKDTDGIYEIICEKLVEIYEKGEEGISELNLQPNGELTVILFVGVNGVGKTTTIGKLAHRLKNQGKK